MTLHVPCWRKGLPCRRLSSFSPPRPAAAEHVLLDCQDWRTLASELGSLTALYNSRDSLREERVRRVGHA